MRQNLTQNIIHDYKAEVENSLNEERLDWNKDGIDWPNREHSMFIHSGGMCWHVQKMGSGPYILLLHGTGASTHSWRDLAPELATQFTVIAPDLPGHGFTEAVSKDSLSLPGMASAVSALLQEMNISPCIVAGHSAGAAILTRMILDRHITPRWIVSMNGAILPLNGLPGLFFAPLAKLFVSSTWGARYFAWRAKDMDLVKRLLDGTGSKIDEHGLKLYARLFQNYAHVSATLRMMANWNLHALLPELSNVETTFSSIVANNDKTIPPNDAHRLGQYIKDYKLYEIDDLGHLAHEENPQMIARIISSLVRKA